MLLTFDIAGLAVHWVLAPKHNGLTSGMPAATTGTEDARTAAHLLCNGNQHSLQVGTPQAVVARTHCT